MGVGKLKEVKLRELWSNEPLFSKWLSDSENLKELEKVLDGLNFSGEAETEVTIEGSKKRIDILAHTTADEPVIIENQLESTDSDHLGRILVYMMSKEVDISVWIAKEIKDHHIKVIKQLNKKIEDKYFYLVQLKAYKIEDSKPAPLFKLICKPEINPENPTENKSLSKDGESAFKFWVEFLEKAEDKTDFFKGKKPIWWAKIRASFKETGYLLGCGRNKDKTYVSINFNPNLKAKFLDFKESLEEKMGFKLEEEKRGNLKVRGKKIEELEYRVDLNGGYESPESEWDKIHTEMLDHFVKLEKALGEILKEPPFKESA